MSDLSIGIRLTADGSAMVGATKVAREEIDKLDQSIDKMNATMARQFSQGGRATSATKEYSASLRSLDDELAGFVASANPAYRAQMQLDQGHDLLNRGLKAGLISQATYNETLAILGTRYKTASEAAEMLAGATGKSMFATVQARREMVVLGHEVVSGNFSRIPGSLMVLAERTGLSAAAFAGLAGPVALAAVAIGAVAVAAIIGAHEQRKFYDMLVLTGNAAGLTADSYNSMARQIAGSADVGIGTAREALMSLAGSGRFSGEALQKTGQVVAEFARLSGEKSGSVVKDFESMADGVAKWAAKHNEQYHFITAAQYVHISALEEEGKKQEAIAATMDAFNEHLKKQTENVGYLVKGWRAVAKAISDAADGWLKIGNLSDFEKNAASAAHINELLKKQGNFPKGTTGYAQIQADIEKEKLAIDAGTTRMAIRGRAALAGEESAVVNAVGIKAVEDSKALHNRYRTNKEKELAEIAKYKADQATLIKAGLPGDSPAQRDDLLAKIREQYAGRKTAGARGDGGVASALNSLGSEAAKLQSETSQILAYGHALDQSKEAIIRFETERGKFKDQSPGKKAALIAGAENVDRLASTKKFIQDQAKDYADLEKEIDKDRMASNKYVESIANANAQRDLEVSLIGKTSAEQKIALEYARIDIELKKQNKSLSGDLVIANTAAAAAAKESISASMEASRTFEAGMKGALASYREEATNTAAQTSRAFRDGFKKAEDVLVNFVKTGKLNFKDFADSVITGLIRIQAQKAVLEVADRVSGSGIWGKLLSLAGNWFGGANNGGDLGVSGGEIGNASALGRNAMGGLYSGSGIEAYRNSVVSSPTVFAFAKGVGLMGEAGSEAIMPLTRTASGALGVHAVGSGGGITVNQSINVTVQSTGDEKLDGEKIAGSLKNSMRQMVMDVLVQQKRPGGMLV